MPSGYAPNPWLEQRADAIADSVSRNYLYNVAPQVRSGAVAAGGYGGSRQGIAEGLAQQGMNRDIATAQANLYGNAYESDANRANTMAIASLNNTTTMRGQDMTRDLGMAGLTNARDIAQLNSDTSRYGTDVNAATSRYGTDTNAATSRYATDANLSLGLGNLGYNYAGLDRAIANDNVANQIALGNFGLNAYDKMMGYDGSAVTAATNIQNTPLDYLNRFTGMANATGGLGGTGSSTTPYFGNPLMGALGGYQLGNAINNAMSGSSSTGSGIGYGAAGSAAGYSFVPDGYGNMVAAL